MAFFGTPNAYVGLDIGTSSLKVVELLDRRKNIELATYAEANIPNLLINPPHGDVDAAIKKLRQVVLQMFERANVSTDAVVAALPNSIVFSTVITLPEIPEKDVDKAIHFAARDVVPADIDEMFLGWSRLGELPHMDDGGSAKKSTGSKKPAQAVKAATATNTNVPIFITAAPKNIVERYQELISATKLELAALEVETFPLIRSLLTSETDSAMIVDIGDQATTFHIIRNGTPRLSHTIDIGGKDITDAIAAATGKSTEEADQLKIEHGLSESGSKTIGQAITGAMDKLVDQAERLLSLDSSNEGGQIRKSVLIGGGAKLKGIESFWTQAIGHRAGVGNPWRGLTYPPPLEPRLKELGPTYGVAVGLAQRELQAVIREKTE